MSEYRRRLPHYHPDGEHLFVTWRLHGSLPALPPDMIYEMPGHAFAAHDRALARSHGPFWLNDQRIAACVMQAILDGEYRFHFYQSQAWVVMPNNVHLLLLPRVPFRQITHWIKGTTARTANVLLGRTGKPFWQHESYDHWVRSERELLDIAAYIERNPVAAGLAAMPEVWPWSSATAAS